MTQGLSSSHETKNKVKRKERMKKSVFLSLKPSHPGIISF